MSNFQKSRALVWVLPLQRLVVVSEDLSPYVEGYGVGVFDSSDTFGWGEAGEVAKAKGSELGFAVDYRPLISDLVEREDDYE